MNRHDEAHPLEPRSDGAIEIALDVGFVAGSCDVLGMATSSASRSRKPGPSKNSSARPIALARVPIVQPFQRQETPELAGYAG